MPVYIEAQEWKITTDRYDSVTLTATTMLSALGQAIQTSGLHGIPTTIEHIRDKRVWTVEIKELK